MRWIRIPKVPTPGVAPFDGNNVLLLTSDFGAVEGWWDDRVTNFYRSQAGWASYDPYRFVGDWVSWWNVADDGDRRLYCGMTPHFWMPKPRMPRDFDRAWEWMDF